MEILEDWVLTTTLVKAFRYSFLSHAVPKHTQFIKHVLFNLDELRFKQFMRMNKSQFFGVLREIKAHEVFRIPSRGRPQYPVATQLAVVLYRIGHARTDKATISALFGISDGGCIQNFTNRVFKAILSLKKKYCYWPDSQERKVILQKTASVFPGCIGMVDGTEIKLSDKPQQNHEVYYSRKSDYSLKVQITCDYDWKVRHVVCGLPGSIHDARIFNNSQLSLNSLGFFDPGEFVLGDSAYKLTSTVLTPFRETISMQLKQRNYNYQLGKLRVRVEHTIGRLKERFESLKDLPIQIKDDESIRFSSDWIMVCCVLHNYLIDFETEKTAIGSEFIDNTILNLIQSLDSPNGTEKRINLMEYLFSIIN